MCHVSIAIDQSVQTIGRLFDALEMSEFYIRSVRVVPVAWSPKADVYFSLGGGSSPDLEALLASLKSMPGVLSTSHVLPAA
jgi:hypothetical protein